MYTMSQLEQRPGYYKVFSQYWIEDEYGEWISSGWQAEEDFELIDIIDHDKHGHPTKALFIYTGPVFLGLQHAAFNISANLLHKFMNIAMSEVNAKKTIGTLREENSEISQLSTAIDVIENEYKIKEYFSNK